MLYGPAAQSRLLSQLAVGQTGQLLTLNVDV